MAERINSDFFLHESFISFVKEVSKLDLLQKEDMVKMDGLVMDLSVSRKANRIGFHRYNKYPLLVLKPQVIGYLND